MIVELLMVEYYCEFCLFTSIFITVYKFGVMDCVRGGLLFRLHPFVC